MLTDHEVFVDVVHTGRAYPVLPNEASRTVTRAPDATGADLDSYDLGPPTLLQLMMLFRLQTSQIAQPPAAERREIDSVTDPEPRCRFQERRANRLEHQQIADIIVDLLRKHNVSHWIIMTTHNANIPVNGYAEQIVTVSVEEGKRLGTVVSAPCTLDSPDAIEDVGAIMEGSAEAFRLRRECYGY